MNKYLAKFGLVGILTFLGLFIYFYQTSGKFRQSIISAFAALTIFFSWNEPADSAGQADAFTQQNQQHQSRPRPQQKGIFSRKSNNDGSGPGKPDDFDSDSGGDGLPQFPQTESVEKTEERVEKINDYLRQMSEVSDSDTESEEDQCPIHEQNKAGIDELPDSSEYIYALETKTAKKALEKVWKNPEAKKEVLAGLDRMNKGELLPRNQKDFKGFKSLKELKFSNTRMLMQPGKDGEPDKIVVICIIYAEGFGRFSS